jgi:iron complex outermembrane receptor protein
VYPNPDLIPETGWSAEIGIKQGLKVGNWIGYVDFCGFITQYKNMIEFRGGVWGQPTDPVGGFGFKSINITNARIPGFEVSSFGSGELFGFPFQYLLGYTFTYPIDLDYDPADPNSQKFLPYRNLHNFKADLQATFLKGLNVGIASIYIGYLEVIDQTYEGVIPGLEQWRDENDNGYWVFDLRLGYTFSEQFKANFIIKNIFNEMYTLRPAFLEAPRSMTFSLQYDF